MLLSLELNFPSSYHGPRRIVKRPRELVASQLHARNRSWILGSLSHLEQSRASFEAVVF